MESFVARIWIEASQRNNARWRGHIQHVQGTEESYFQSLSEMRRFLEGVSGVPWPASPSQPVKLAPKAPRDASKRGQNNRFQGEK